MRAACVVLSVVLIRSVAYGQDNQLTPTDILESGGFYGTVQLRGTLGEGDLSLSSGSATLDLEAEVFDAILTAGVGLGHGLEVEVEIPYQFRGIIRAEEGGVEFESETGKFGDLTIRGLYRILKEDASGPQWVAGPVVVAPVGWGRLSQEEIKIGGVTVQEGEKGGIGEGVWRFGVASAISKRFGASEPYLAAVFLSGDERERGNVEEEQPERLIVLGGSEFHFSPEVTLDVRATLTWEGEHVTEEPGDIDTEESHFVYGGQAQFYVRLGKGVTFLVGGGVSFVEDHLLSEEDVDELENTFFYYGFIGLHFVFKGL